MDRWVDSVDGYVGRQMDEWMEVICKWMDGWMGGAVGWVDMVDG